MSKHAALYLAYRASIFNYIRTRVQIPGTSLELVEDMTSQVFLKAIESMQRGTEVAHVSGWLHRIARNLIIDHYRQRDQLPTCDYDDAARYPARELPPHEQAVSAIGCARIWHCIDRLTDEQAEVIVATIAGCTSEHLGDMVGCERDAAKGRLHRARVRLKEMLADTEIDFDLAARRYSPDRKSRVQKVR